MDEMRALVRRWAVDWLGSHDPSVLSDLVTEDYELRIGGVALRGRQTYERAVVGQLAQFPGLVLTVHDLLVSGDRAAIRFTEHGASAAHEGRSAAWGGIALFRAEHGRLSATVAEEDYAARRRQLRHGIPDVVEPPHIAPWDIDPQAPDAHAEAIVRTWITAGMPDSEGLLVDDQALGQPVDPVVVGEDALVDELFSAGERVAFHVTPRTLGSITAPAAPLAGIVTVRHGNVVTGRLVRDRLGAERRRASAAPPSPT